MQTAIHASCLAFTFESYTTILLSALPSAGPLRSSSSTVVFPQASLLHGKHKATFIPAASLSQSQKNALFLSL